MCDTLVIYSPATTIGSHSRESNGLGEAAMLGGEGRPGPVSIMPVNTTRRISNSETDDEYLHVEVRYPRTYTHDEKGKFTDYEIHIETNKIAFSRRTSTVRRRFSEFFWLRKQLASVEVNGVGKGSVPNLPPRKMVGRFLPAFLAMRQEGLQRFLDSVMKINKFLSYSGLHLFLQSPLSIVEIENFLNGKYGDKTVEDMLEDCGCASNTDNPFSVFLRSDQSTGFHINRSQSCNGHPSTTSQDDNLLGKYSIGSSDMSSGSFPGAQREF